MMECPEAAVFYQSLAIMKADRSQKEGSELMAVEDLKEKLVLKTIVNPIISAAGNKSETMSE